MRWAVWLSATLMLGLLSAPALANNSGLVVNQNTECDFFMLKMPAGMTLLKSSQKKPPTSGTRMNSQSPLTERDFAILISPEGDEYRVWVDQLNRSIADVIQEYHRQCGH